MSVPRRPARQKLMPAKPSIQRKPNPTHHPGVHSLSNNLVRKLQDQQAQGKSQLTTNDMMTLQRTMGNQVVQRLLDEQGMLPTKSGNESASRPLPTEVRTKMEQSFGTSFADVRIHQGSQADAMGARAYAQGSNIYVQRSININGYEGQKVLAHELAHVVQQRTGRVPNSSAAVINDDPMLETEAHRAADKAANGTPVTMAGGTNISHVQRTPAKVIQRWPKWLKRLFGKNRKGGGGGGGGTSGGGGQRQHKQSSKITDKEMIDTVYDMFGMSPTKKWG